MAVAGVFIQLIAIEYVAIQFSLRDFFFQCRAHNPIGINAEIRAPPNCQAAHAEYLALSRSGNDPNHAVCIAHIRQIPAIDRKTIVNSHKNHLLIFTSCA